MVAVAVRGLRPRRSEPSTADKVFGYLGLKLLNFLGIESRSTISGNPVYAGAANNRLTSDWVASLLSADQEISGNLRLLRARSRELARNNPIAKNYLNLLAANVVGPKGIGYSPQVRNNDGSLNRMFNEKIEDAWEDWGAKGNCTVDGKLSWRQVLELAVKNTATDGEVFIRKVQGFDNKYGFAVQLIDSDHCDHLYNIPANRGGNEVRLGVEVDVWGRPVAYWITPGYYTDVNSQARERIPADQIIHLYDPDRISQTRGISWFHAVMLQLRMLEGYIEAELVAARTGAAKMGFIQCTDASAYEPPEDPAQKYILEASPGTIDQLPPGYTFVPWSPDHPVGAFPAFVITIMRQVATGLGVSYNALASDLVGVNYSSMRSGLLIERDQWKRHQQWAIESACAPVFKPWLGCALLSGSLVLDTRDPARFLDGKWTPRGWQWVDPLKDVQSAVLAIGAKIKSREDILDDEGRDVEELFEQLGMEDELAEDYGIDLTLPSAQKPTGAPEDNTEDEAGTSADAGAKQLAVVSRRLQ